MAPVSRSFGRDPIDAQLVERVVAGEEVPHSLVGREQHATAVGPAPHHVGEGAERGAEPPTHHDPIARGERRAEDVPVELHGAIVAATAHLGAS